MYDDPRWLVLWVAIKPQVERMAYHTYAYGLRNTDRIEHEASPQDLEQEGWMALNDAVSVLSAIYTATLTIALTVVRKAINAARQRIHTQKKKDEKLENFAETHGASIKDAMRGDEDEESFD